MISSKREIILHLDQVATEAEFGDALLHLSAPYGVECVVAGAIQRDTLRCEQLECVKCAVVTQSAEKQKGSFPEAILDMNMPRVHCFSRDGDGKVKHLVCNPRGRPYEASHLVKELVFPIMTTPGADWGFAFFGRDLASDDASVRNLAFIANYAFARMLKIEKLGFRPRLSPRQSEVLKWAAEGKTDAEIATILDVSTHTVDKHMRQIKEALGAANRTAAIVNAMRYGLIS
jgi:DNA-binding CsgD family transcriptional regulator